MLNFGLMILLINQSVMSSSDSRSSSSIDLSGINSRSGEVYTVKGSRLDWSSLDSDREEVDPPSWLAPAPPTLDEPTVDIDDPSEVSVSIYETLCL